MDRNIRERPKNVMKTTRPSSSIQWIKFSPKSEVEC